MLRPIIEVRVGEWVRLDTNGVLWLFVNGEWVIGAEKPGPIYNEICLN